MNVAGAGVLASSDVPDAAIALIDWLLCAEAQAAIATGTFEYPLVAGVAADPRLPAIDTIGFGMGPRLGEVDGPVDLAFQPSLETWKGRTRVSLKIRDFRTADSAELSATGS